jgi:type III secretion protein U
VRGVRALGPDAFRAAWGAGARAPAALLLGLGPTLLQAAAALLALGLGDLALARRRHLRSLRMSREELRREQRSAEGDPHAKGQRRARHRALASGGPARGVPAATVVVVNPTHLAVALRFVEAECDAPYIVARGHGEDALKLKREAAARHIPVVKDVPLARALVQYEPGEEVPEELYQAAAAVLKVALEVGGHQGRGRRGGAGEGGT